MTICSKCKGVYEKNLFNGFAGSKSFVCDACAGLKNSRYEDKYERFFANNGTKKKSNINTINASEYKILGLKSDANKDAVRSAYLSLALEHHPDKGGCQEKFKEIKKAYEKILDSFPN